MRITATWAGSDAGTESIQTGFGCKTRFIQALVLFMVAGPMFANQLHYIPLNNDPIWSPKMVDHLDDPEIPVYEWIILSGLNDPDYFTRSGTSADWVRPELVPLSDTTGVFDAPAREDISNSETTAFYEYEVTVLAARDDTSLEIGLTDLINFIRWSEAQQTIRADRDDQVENTDRWLDFAPLPLRLQIYYNFAEFVITFVLIDQLGESTSFSWQAESTNPFVNFFADGIGGTDPDNLIIYPWVSCQVDCSLNVLDWDMYYCDTVAGEIDVDSCAPTGPARPEFEGLLEDRIEIVTVDEHSTGLVFDVDANNGNGGPTDSDVSYAITGGNLDVDGDTNPPFSIDATSGELTVNDPDDLDFDAGIEEFYLSVDAEDELEVLTTRAYLIVELQDIDDVEVRFRDGFE